MSDTFTFQRGTTTFQSILEFLAENQLTPSKIESCDSFIEVEITQTLKEQVAENFLYYVKHN